MDILGYSVLQQGRNLSGEGVLLYINNNSKAKILHSSKTTQQGQLLRIKCVLGFVLCGKVTIPDPTILVVLIYRPSDGLLRLDRQLLRLLRTTYPDFSHKVIYLKWQFYSLGDGLAILNGEPPNKSITWFLIEKVNDAVKVYTYGWRNVQWICDRTSDKKFSIVDLNLFGCPAIEQLTIDSTRQMQPSRDCASRNVFMYKN